jgi:hypothetical protein
LNALLVVAAAAMFRSNRHGSKGKSLLHRNDIDQTRSINTTSIKNARRRKSGGKCRRCIDRK